MKKILALLLTLALLMTLPLSLFAEVEPETQDEILVEDGIALSEDYIVEYGESYYLMEEVALYLYAFAELPPNYITKNEAMDLGWNSRKGNLWDVAPGACIGGDRFGNYEGTLPRQRGRQYYECDVNYEGGYRDEYRIIFSNDGLIYYTEDHYESFELLYEGWYEEDAWYPKAA